ncbi:bifunctional diguanylate cyclase/phosphodiesterase [Aquabacter cavernae]|uniref:bifunctional diguanylate cyclase/phosphodiesterase n=1 Tax=Aquabacter cavernae TaxID=2496029 RepID=UPI0013DF192F|nr:bifunctional diguanylate cyclase/phosphodiesterase [Aquabacter cavernae]
MHSSPAYSEGDAYAFAGQVSRGLLVEALIQLLKPAGRAQGWSLLLVGIDHLGRMNDTFGFAVVDQIVGEIAARLRKRVPQPDLVARFSGGKFAILSRRNGSGQAAADLAAAICTDVSSAPFETSAGPMPVTVTVGGVIAPERATTLNAVLAAVQEALDKAKRQARGSYRLYERNDSIERRRRTNQRTAEEIVRAIWDRRIFLALQPVVNTTSRQIFFYEALARIVPLSGARLTEAGQMAEAAERLGLIGFLDRHVLDHAMEALRRDPTLRLSVNVSPTSIADHSWLRQFADQVTPDLADRVIVELTESAAVNDLSAARTFIRTARELGARVALDDFGAGSTSFRNLRSLGVDMVKIDGSFVRNMARSPDDRAFVRALLQLARQLGISTVAEWVRSEKEAGFLLAEGCDYIQGALTGLATPYDPAGENA